MRRRFAAALVVGAVVGPLLSIAPAAAADVDVAAANFEFTPREVQVEAGDTVSWTNGDPEPHTVTADDGSFSILLNPGETKSHTFDEDGEVAYFCKLHGAPGGEGMAGVVLVGAAEPPETVHLGGTDNIARSIAWSQLDHPDGAGFAIIGRADSFADSLSSGAVQGKLGGPLLLTGSSSLDSRVAAELDRLDPSVVYLLGGTGALSGAVSNELSAKGYTVRRVAGTDRLRTAIAAANTFFPEATSAILVRAFAGGGDPTRAFVDSLGAGAVAASTGRPIVFTETGALSDVTKQYLASQPITSVTIVGGTAAVSEAVEASLTQMGIEVDRAAGFGRADTARVLVGRGEFSHDSVVVVDGTSTNAWADGFAAAGHGAPVILSAGDVLPGATAQELGFSESSTQIICGATVTATACGVTEITRELDLDLPALAAHVDDEERGGQPGAGGASGLYFGSDGTTVCYDYFGTPLEITAAHVHDQASGDPVLPMTLEPSTENDPFGCSFGVDEALVADLQANPADYYINVHTADHPNGAVSGTLTHIEALALAAAVGDAEVPAPGDPDGLAFSFVLATDTPGELCVVLLAFGFSSEPTAAHIHRGASGQNGDIVVTLKKPAETAPPIDCYDVGESLVNEIRTNPGGFYVNVHTTDYPNGAARGQLLSAG